MAALIIALVVAGVVTGAVYSQPAARAAAGGAWQRGSTQAREEARRGWDASRSWYRATQARLTQPIVGADGKKYPPGPRNWQWWWSHLLRATAGTATATVGTVYAAGCTCKGAGRVIREATRGGRAGYQRYRDTLDVEEIKVVGDGDQPQPEPPQRQERPADAAEPAPPPQQRPATQPGGRTVGHIPGDGTPCGCPVCTGLIPPAAPKEPAAPTRRRRPDATPVPPTAAPLKPQKAAAPPPAPLPVAPPADGPPRPGRRFYPPLPGEQVPRLPAAQVEPGDRLGYDGEYEVVAVDPWTNGPDTGVTVRSVNTRTGAAVVDRWPNDAMLRVRPVTEWAPKMRRASTLALGDQIAGTAGGGRAVAEIVGISDDGGARRLTVREIGTGLVHETTILDDALVYVPSRPVDHPQPMTTIATTPVQHLKPGDQIAGDKGSISVVVAVEPVGYGQTRVTTRLMGASADPELADTRTVGRGAWVNRLVPPEQPDAPAGQQRPFFPAVIRAETPTLPPGKPATPTEKETDVQAEATTLAQLKNTLAGEMASLDQRVASADSLIGSLSGQGIDPATINGLSAYQDGITAVRAQLQQLLAHVEAKHNQMAEAVQAAGGSSEVAKATFYDEG
jgi:hypothetical protein